MKIRLRLSVLSFLLLFISNLAVAQLIGGDGNGQSPTEEVSAAEINAGGISGDVNLFTGTYSTSYTLGSVSTPTGLSYTASLSYSSNFSSGDNLPHTTGIPYGEGWSLSMPTISVSAEDYNKYNEQEMELINNSDGTPNAEGYTIPFTPLYTAEEAEKEGRLYWFAPKLNIPGAGGGRMVFKEKRSDTDYVFVLNKFERHIEAHFDRVNSTWKIILDDGTEYEMIAMVISHRNASNQRVQSLSTPAFSNLINPKTEVLSWYCTRITHPNKAGEISFSYEKYGCFNFFEQYPNYSCEEPENEMLPACKEIYLTEISSGYERLELDYANVLQGAPGGYINPLSGSALLKPDGSDGSIQVDNLYRSQVVYDLLDESSGQGGAGSWFEYAHGRSPDLQFLCNEHLIMTSPTNPYLVLAHDLGNTYSELGYLRKSADITGNQVEFGHGFLESPTMDMTHFPAGDTYEIATELRKEIGSSAKSLFDISLVAGEHLDEEPSLPVNTLSDYGAFPKLCYDKSRGEQVFSTFNQARKWALDKDNYNSRSTSNFFVMPNLPQDFADLRLQVGPSNSDNKFTLEDYNLDVTEPDDVPYPLYSYYNEFQNWDDYNYEMQSGDPAPSNFGIGIPWYMMHDQYSGTMDYLTTTGWESFWWNSARNDAEIPGDCTGPYWDNRPTRARNPANEVNDNTINLSRAVIKRYAKSPYMLQAARKYVMNGNGGEAEVSNLMFRYQLQRINRYVHVKEGPGYEDATVRFKDFRNVLTLNQVRQLPTGITDFTDAPAAPTTTLEYDLTNFLADQFPGIDCEVGLCESYYNSNFVLLNKIIDPLGKETTLDYFPLPSLDMENPEPQASSGNKSFSIPSFIYRPRPGELSSPSISGPNLNYCTGGPSVKKGDSYAFQVFMLLKSKTVVDRGIEKSWNYTYSDFGVIDDFPRMVGEPGLPELFPPGSNSQYNSFLWDKKFDFSYGSGTTRVTGPSINGVNGPMTIYKHKTDYLLWGKLWLMESYDINGNKISDTQTSYDAIKAFHADWADATNPDDSGFNNDDDGEWSHPDMKKLNCTFELPYYYETRYGPDITAKNPDYLHSYFIRKNHTINKVWSGSEAMTNTEVYSYYDRDYTGVSTCPGYDKIGVDKNNIYYEPSWQLYSITSSSPHHEGTSTQEFFYLYDLANNLSYNYDETTGSSSLNLLTNVRSTTHNRTVAYESRTSQYSPSGKSGNHVHSVYSLYSLDFPGLSNKMYLRKSSIQVRPGVAEVMHFDGNTPVIPHETLTTLNVLQRDSETGQVKLSEDQRGLRTLTVYNSVGIPEVMTIGAGLADELSHSYTYTSKNEIETITDPNGMILEYTYDGYGRMVAGTRNGVLIQSVGYSNWESAQTDLTFLERAQQNFVSTTNYVEPAYPGPVMSWVDISYIDPLGRNLENTHGGATVGATVHDIYDRPILNLRPGASSFDNLITFPAAHMETEYYPAPRAWVSASSKFGESISGDRKVIQEQSIVTAGDLSSLLQAANQNVMPPGSRFMKQVTTDEDGKTAFSYSNARGQLVATISMDVEDDGSSQEVKMMATVFLYDHQGQLMRSSNPANQSSVYRYNYLGLLKAKSTIDGGSTLYAYNQSGQLIGEKFANAQTRLYAYDAFGRMTVQARVSFAGSIFSLDGGLPWIQDPELSGFDDIFNSTEARFERSWHYNDFGLSNTGYPSNVEGYVNNDLTYVLGRVSQTVSYNNDGQPIENRYLSYNFDGFLKWEMMFFNENGIGIDISVPDGGFAGRSVRILYPEYNLQGSYKKMQVDINADHFLDFQYINTYDNQNRLEEVFVSYNDPETETDLGYKIASYDYDDIRQLVTHKKYYAAGINEDGSTCEVEIDHAGYAYDQRLRMTDIQSTLFDWKMYYDGNSIPYHQEDFEANYNGNINATLATYKLAAANITPEVTTWDEATAYNYQYDGLNRLVKANRFGTAIDGNANVPGYETFGDTEYTYDKVGNLMTLIRGEYDADAQSVDLLNLTYQYEMGTNKLLDVMNGSQAYGSYSYDANGNLLSDSHRDMSSVTYGRANLPFAISKLDVDGASQSIAYLYDANDARIYKTVAPADGGEVLTKEYYIRNAAGQELAIFNILGEKLTWYVYGLDRVAKIGHQPDIDFEKDVEENGPKDIKCVPGPPECSEREQGEQYASLAQVRAMMAGQSSTTLTYPTKMYRVRLCDGHEMNLLESELADLAGNHSALQVININSATQLFDWYGAGVASEGVSLDNLLAARVQDEQIYINGYEPCRDYPVCKFVEQVVASEVIPSSIIGDSLEFDYRSHGVSNPDLSTWPGAENSLQDDGVYWRLFGNESYLTGETGWDIGQDFNVPGAVITGYEVNYEIRNYYGGELTVALHDGVHIIRNTSSPGSGRIVFPSDELPTLEQIKNMKLSMHLNSVGIEIDVVSATIYYDAPCDCDEEAPDCTTTDGEQSSSIGSWAGTARTIEQSAIRYPTKLYRLRMCDSTEISVLRQEMSMLEGTFKVLQRTEVYRPEQLFEVRSAVGVAMQSFHDIIETRRGDVSVEVDGYDPCAPDKTDTPTTPPPTTDGPLDDDDHAPVPTATYYQYDHLGNTRVTYGVVAECQHGSVSYVLNHVADYYPYGKVLRELIPVGTPEKFLTTYHERDRETGLDYRGARFYDSDVCRFLSLDPLAADYAAWSAYNYVLGNPVKFVDPDGRAVTDPVITSQTTVRPFYRKNGQWAGVQVTQTTITTSSRLANYSSQDRQKEMYQNPPISITERTTETISIQYNFDFDGANKFSMYIAGSAKASVTETIEKSFTTLGESDGVVVETKENDSDGLMLNSGTEKVIEGVATVADKIGLSVQEQEAGLFGNLSSSSTEYGPISGTVAAIVGLIAADIEKDYDLGSTRVHYENKGIIDSNGKINITSEKFD